jgi:hypothetical protein
MLKVIANKNYHQNLIAKKYSPKLSICNCQNIFKNAFFQKLLQKIYSKNSCQKNRPKTLSPK